MMPMMEMCQLFSSNGIFMAIGKLHLLTSLKLFSSATAKMQLSGHTTRLHGWCSFLLMVMLKVQDYFCKVGSISSYCYHSDETDQFKGCGTSGRHHARFPISAPQTWLVFMIKHVPVTARISACNMHATRESLRSSTSKY
jgi:hypothetical protein